MSQLNTKVYQMPTDPASVEALWKSASGCASVPEPTVNDMFESAGTLSDKLGASEKCKRYTEKGNYHQSAEGGASGGLFGGSLFGAAASFKQQVTVDMNRASQEGCGTMLITAGNILQTSQQLQCVINNSMTSATSLANMSNVVTIVGQPLTPSQDANLAALLVQQNATMAETNARASKDWLALVTANPPVSDSVLARTQAITNNEITLMKATFADQLALYTRNISLSEVKVLQEGTVSIKTECKLSSEDVTKIEALSQKIAKDVAEQGVAQTLGVNAQDPSIKEAVSNNKQIADNLSAEKINTLVSQAQNSLSVSNSLTITTAGNINLNDVTFDQDIVVSMITSAIMGSAISTGLKAASEITTDNQTVQAIASTVKGLEDYLEALKKMGNISTPPPAPEGSTTSTIGLYIFLIILCIVGAGGAYLYYTQGPGASASGGTGSGSESGTKSSFRFHSLGNGI